MLETMLPSRLPSRWRARAMLEAMQEAMLEAMRLDSQIYAQWHVDHGVCSYPMGHIGLDSPGRAMDYQIYAIGNALWTTSRTAGDGTQTGPPRMGTERVGRATRK